MSFAPNISQLFANASSNDASSSLLSIPAAKTAKFAQLEAGVLERAVIEKRDEKRVEKALSATREITGVHNDRNRKAYVLAEHMHDIDREKLWEELNCKSLSEYIETICPFRRSTAYRYIKVGAFMKELNIQSVEFEEAFYEQTGIEPEVVYDRNNVEDPIATREANRLTTRIRYMDMDTICSVYASEGISFGECRELMAKSILLNEEDFKKSIRELKGEINPLTEAEKIYDAGFSEVGVVLPIRPEYSRADIVQELTLLLVSLKAGDLDNALAGIKDHSLAPVASKTTRYISADGFKFITL